MHTQPTDISNQELEIKHLCEDICEAYQEGIAVWDSRVENLLIDHGQDLESARELRDSFEKAWRGIAKTYMGFYKQAGAHFAIGDSQGKTQERLASKLNCLNTRVIEVLQQAPDDAIAGVPWLPGSFQNQYNVIRYYHLQQQSDHIWNECVKALQDLFSEISAWAVPIHTLPPLVANRPSTSPPISVHEAENFFERIRAPFHRQRYEYEKLPTQYSFRLVRILTARPSVTCEIKTFDLVTSPPPFHGLSYCWGKYGQHSDIWCNEQLFKVSSNLKKGLQRLHKYGAWSRVKWFWIDQICINQNDFEERTQQVRFMRAIYQRAQNTVIWLGSDDASARGAFSIIGDLYALMIQVQKKQMAAHVESHSQADVQVTLPPEADERWASLSKFVDLPWFERCWIIQEVVVSPGDPVLLCGGFQILWSRFQESIAGLLQYHSRFRTDRVKLIKGILDLSSKSEVWELSSLLQSTRPFQATDPRDKIFALLGLAGESRTPEKWPKSLIPDYNRSTQDVYTAVTLYCIARTNTLTVLSQAGNTTESNDNSGDASFPSWVPRWYEATRVCNISAFEITQSQSGWKLLVEKFNSASGDLDVSRHVHTPLEVLRLEGIQVATVELSLPAISPEVTGSISSTDSLPTSLHSRMLKTLPELLTICRSHLIHLPNETFLRTFFLVTTAGLTPEQTDARHEPMTHFRAFLRTAMPRTPEVETGDGSLYNLRRAFRSNLSISTLTPNLTPPASTDSIPAPKLSRESSSSSDTFGTVAFDSPFAQREEEANPSRYTSALTPLLHRRLFITSTGHLGLGPEAMMSGDVVVVLFGGKVPFVLRRVGDEQWKLIGECYVNGFMHGEALEQQGRNRGDGKRRIEHEWFDLV
ncbi:hypothetical protein N0V90_003163 [Kalmusia sp. IMI 367209]|nr:hypothetical protein N0V90_003163 [Kalmusia sp. IMI 367209]